eukprot:6213896-Pleurochrysis_carterae.AAC.5
MDYSRASHCDKRLSPPFPVCIAHLLNCPITCFVSLECLERAGLYEVRLDESDTTRVGQLKHGRRPRQHVFAAEDKLRIVGDDELLSTVSTVQIDRTASAGSDAEGNGAQSGAGGTDAGAAGAAVAAHGAGAAGAADLNGPDGGTAGDVVGGT